MYDFNVPPQTPNNPRVAKEIEKEIKATNLIGIRKGGAMRSMRRQQTRRQIKRKLRGKSKRKYRQSYS